MSLEFGLVNLGDNLAHPVTGLTHSDADKHLRILRQAKAAEAAGFSVFQLGEHHFNYFTVSAPTVVLASIAQQTTTIRLGTGVTLLATRDPVTVAEEFATLDVLSNGRAEIGVGRGVHESIFRAMGRSSEHASEMLSEGIELLHRLLTETDVHWSGQWRTPLDGVTIRPRPLQQPIPIWSGSSSAIELCARLGIPCMWVSVLHPFEELQEVAAEYREAWRDAGRPLSTFQLGVGVHYHVAKTSQIARRRFVDRYKHYLDCSATVEKSQLKRRITPRRDGADLYDTVPIVGSPAEAADRIALAQDQLGLTRISLVADMGGLPENVVQEVMDLTGSDVIPALSA